MSRPIILNATSPHEIQVDRKTGAAMWKSFLKTGSRHSAQASTLPYLIRRCEQTGTPYVLEAWPGQGYSLTVGVKL